LLLRTAIVIRLALYGANQFVHSPIIPLTLFAAI